ncbi:MAG: Hsp70 family protein [Acidobacteria bacterium]|nr:Hsp70 family protein [Acidobacteriota bacterium]
MRLGIDFGTTRIVVSWVDRGNYPLVSFDSPHGASRDWFPALAAFHVECTGERVYGWDAWTKQAEPGWASVRSLKRLLSELGPATPISVGPHRFPALDLYRELALSLRKALFEASNLTIEAGEPLEVILGVPAHANSNQRFLTAEAFRLAGFQVLAMLNEPSAAAVEFGHRNKMTKDRILVYDLGGGTFDASVVALTESERSVLASEGIATLGGDEFDLVMAEMALEAMNLDASEMSQQEWFLLVEACREKKEALHPNTRKIEIDLEGIREAGGRVTLAVADFYERAWPLVAETLHATTDLLSLWGGMNAIEAIYVTGGGSELPLVARQLKEQYGRKVKRSAYMRAATAIGLAIHADQQSGYTLKERFHQYFGVWREADQGRRIVFDPIFAKGTELPAAKKPPLLVERHYRPVHNVGHFRFLESTRIADDQQPAGEISYWDEILFPFDPALENHGDLADITVGHNDRAHHCEIVERYRCDANGQVSVEIANQATGYSKIYPLARWGHKGEAEAAELTTKKRKARKAAKA